MIKPNWGAEGAFSVSIRIRHPLLKTPCFDDATRLTMRVTVVSVRSDCSDK